MCAIGYLCQYLSCDYIKNTEWPQLYSAAITHHQSAAGETWEATAGLFLAEECPEIAHVEAAVISCNFGSTEYTNRLYDAWKETYLNQKLEDWMR